jgi:hypothetical protein
MERNLRAPAKNGRKRRIAAISVIRPMAELWCPMEHKNDQKERIYETEK